MGTQDPWAGARHDTRWSEASTRRAASLIVFAVALPAGDSTFRLPLVVFPNSVTGGRVAVASVGAFTASPFLVGLPSVTIGSAE